MHEKNWPGASARPNTINQSINQIICSTEIKLNYTEKEMELYHQTNAIQWTPTPQGLRGRG